MYQPGYWVDVTSLAIQYGWERVPALPNWRTFYRGARFTEFALTDGLDWYSAMLADSIRLMCLSRRRNCCRQRSRPRAPPLPPEPRCPRAPGARPHSGVRHVPTASNTPTPLAHALTASANRHPTDSHSMKQKFLRVREVHRNRSGVATAP